MCPEAVSLFEGSSFKAGDLSFWILYAFYHRQW